MCVCAFKGNCQLTTNSMLPTVKDNGWRCYSRALEHRRTVGGHGWQRKDARKVTLANRLLFPLRCAQSALPLVSSARKGRDSSPRILIEKLQTDRTKERVTVRKRRRTRTLLPGTCPLRIFWNVAVLYIHTLQPDKCAFLDNFLVLLWTLSEDNSIASTGNVVSR